MTATGSCMARLASGEFKGSPRVSTPDPVAARDDAADLMEELGRQDLEIERLIDAETVLGYCPHGVNLDRDFCPKGCRV